jgi:hypothetical protein
MLSFHPTRHRLEVRFPKMPPQRVIVNLKSYGYHWDRQNKVWWLAKPKDFASIGGVMRPVNGFDKALQYAAGAIGATPADIERVKQDKEAWQHQLGAQGMA